MKALVDWLTRPEGRRWLLRAMLAVAVGGFVIWMQRTGDFSGYVAVGNLVLAGSDAYSVGANKWPPFFSLFCVPLALLSNVNLYLARGVWIVLNLWLLLLILRMIVRLVYGADLSLRADALGLSLAAPEVLIPLLISYRFVLSNFDNLQVNILIFALTLGGLSWAARGRELAGGTLIGLAAAMKVMPVLFIPYLAYRGRYRVAASAFGAAAAFSLSPILVFGWGRFCEYVLAWRAALEVGWGVKSTNQSIFAMWDRFIGHGILPLSLSETMLPNSGDSRVMVAVAATLATIVIAALVIFRGPIRQDGWAALSEWSAVFIIGALGGLLTWKHYLIVLLLPYTLLFAAWRTPGLDASTRRVIGTLLLVSFALGGLTSRGIVGKTLGDVFLMSSAITLSALVLLGGMFWFRARFSSASAYLAGWGIRNWR